MRFSEQIVELFRNMYKKQEAAVSKPPRGLTKWFQIGQYVRQGCMLSPHLLNIYSKSIIRKALVLSVQSRLGARL